MSSLLDRLIGRRRFFGLGAATLAAGATTLTPDNAAAEPGPPMPALNDFLIGPHRYRVRAWTLDAWEAMTDDQRRAIGGTALHLPGVGVVVVEHDRPYGRWERGDLEPDEQPTPRSTRLDRMRGDVVIYRTWDDDAPARCRLCYECTARKMDGGTFAGQTLCMTQAPGDIADDEAPLWSQRGTEFDRPWVRVPAGIGGGS